MIPDYLTFIRYQDNRFIPSLYFIFLILPGFYWVNNGYQLTEHDAGLISGILAITLFHLIYDLKAYWAYKCVMKNIDFSFFHGKTCSRTEVLVSHPLTVSILSVLVFWSVIKYTLMLSEGVYGILGLYILLPFSVYWVFRWLRGSYIKQVGRTLPDTLTYPSLFRYSGFYILSGMFLNVLTVSPLKSNPDFSMSEGLLTPKLVLAMLTLSVIILMMNLMFSRLSKRYVLLGKLFLKEIDFYFSSSIPCGSFYAKPILLRMIIYLIVQFIWILFIGVLLTLSGLNLLFEIYFILCFLPSVGYYWLSVYWLWHHDFLAACDMYFRWGEITKRSHFW